MEQIILDNTSDIITQLKGPDRVRKRPSVIFGSDGIDGCSHSIFEVLSNALDEAREGRGDRIEITRFADSSIKIRDYAQGIPLEFNEREKRYNWELIFCELYAGGKFDNNESETYSFSLGLNGLGLCSTQYASEFMDATVYSGGFKYTLHFEKGENIGGLHKEPTDEKTTGTIIYWKPDTEVFTDIDIGLQYYLDILKRQAIINAGITLALYDEESDKDYEFYYANGINDYIIEVSANKSLTLPVFFHNEAKGRDREDRPEYKLKYDIVFCFNNEINLMEYYHNSSFLEHGGAPDRACRTAFLAAIDNYAKTAGLYKKDEKKIIFADIADSLILISNSFSTITSFENQTKKSITNKFIQDSMTDFLKKQIEVYFAENKVEADKIAGQVIINKRSREGAEKTRMIMKKKLVGSMDLSNRVEKFVNCRTKDISKRELYIVEGDSALGACKLGRDAEFQAIMPVRGKILNCLKADYDKIFANDIIIDLLRVLGCGVEIKHKSNKDLSSFDLGALTWNKIIICTDADIDGFQIRTLILTMLYRLVPTLITVGKVYIAESPLYEINYGRKTFFAYSDAEKNKIISKFDKKYRVQRSKGLGENEPDMMWRTTMCPETRKLIGILVRDTKKTEETFELLLGENIKNRKEYIENFGHMYLDLSDVV